MNSRLVSFGWNCVRAGCLASCLILPLAGCGKKSAPPPTTGSPPGDTSPEVPDTTKPEPPKIVKVWFDDPVNLANDTTTVAVARAEPKVIASANTPTEKAPPPKEEVKAPAASSGGNDWPSIISAESVTSETKRIKNKLTDGMQSLSKYNGNYKEMQADAAVMAALACAMIEHSESVTWKKDAPHIRDLAGEVATKSKGLDRANYEPAKEAWEKLNSLLEGNKPAKLEEAAPKIPPKEVAARLPIMRRMEKAFQNMKSNITTEDILKKQGETVVVEASVLGALARIISDKSYGSADEKEYQDFLALMIKTCQQTSEAAKNGDFAKFQDAVNKLNKACNDCHQSFRFSDG